MPLEELYRIVTDALMTHTSDEVDIAVENLYQALSYEITEQYMLEHGYEKDERGCYINIEL
ncbi:MAG: hypothetical protein J6K58_14120 [Lachnospiraceae bacterium]|nr:hypothetical protein [Lachnospiraceae bacterium]